MRAAFSAAVITGASSAAMYGIGGSQLFTDRFADIAVRSLLAGYVGGVTSVLQGGKFGHGFISAGISMGVGLKFAKNGDTTRAVAATIAGGTISELTGGKFANGAATAAFASLVASAAQSSVEGGGYAGDAERGKELLLDENVGPAHVRNDGKVHVRKYGGDALTVDEVTKIDASLDRMIAHEINRAVFRISEPNFTHTETIRRTDNWLRNINGTRRGFDLPLEPLGN